MKISYNEATALECSTLEKDLLLCEKIGYDFIEIRLDMLRDYLKTKTAKDLKTFFDNNRIKPHAFNALFNINFCDDKVWEAIIDDFMLACKIGAEIDSHYVVVVPTITKEPCTRSEKDIFEDSVANLSKLSDIGRDYAMKIAFEPVGNEGCCVRTVKQGWEIVKYIDREDVGITLDPFNLYLYHKMNDFKDMKIVDTNKLFAVHVNDGDDLPLEVLDHCDRCFPGNGIINLKNYITTLREMNYKGPVSIETFRPSYWAKDPEWVIKEAYETTKKLLESV